VVGGSGTGKSVLMRSIIGLQIPEEGSIEVLGRSITDARDDADIDIRSRWGVLFQGGALFSTLTVGENVEVPLREFYPEITDDLRGEIARYKVLLSGLPANATNKYPSELSGGMKKRAGLPARSRSIPNCCSLTNRPPGSTRSAPPRSIP
jgi:phospholipid/cholesterol/gamma-HCH transport system ATP-binding protein